MMCWESITTHDARGPNVSITIYEIGCLIVSFCRNIDDVDKTMDEINEQTENMKQIQEALSNPIGASADFDEVFTHFPCVLPFVPAIL